MRAALLICAALAASSAQAQKPEDLEIQNAIRVARTIKAATKNPASFHLESFLIYPGGATCYEYRGTNSFNAVVLGRAVYLPATGKILLQDNNPRAFVKAWNDTCTKPGGKERARGLNMLGTV